MKINWVITSLIGGLLGGVITYWITGNWPFSIGCSILVFAILLLHNPVTRYMRAFYVALFPILSNLFFVVQYNTPGFNLKAGLKEMDKPTTYILGSIAFLCLIFDYLERSGNLKGTLFEVNKNSSKIGPGSSNITINQTINKKKGRKNG
jgi:hypothetical protein